MTDVTPRRRVVIMGAAGRDFHNFQCRYRDDPAVEVVAFTATQIPSIAGRRYPASLAGASYAQGIPIYPETELGALIATHQVDEVVFAYSDVSQQTVRRRSVASQMSSGLEQRCREGTGCKAPYALSNSALE